MSIASSICSISVVPYEEMEDAQRNVIYIGHVLDVLKKMADESIDVFLFSPPYYAKRNYTETNGKLVVEPLVWGGDDPSCVHKWETVMPARQATEGDLPGINSKINKNKSNLEVNRPAKPTEVCPRCGAWRGDLGNEPSFKFFILHLAQICDEIKRILKPWGSLFVNLGDSYGGSGGAGGDWDFGKKALEGKWKQPKFDYPHQCLMLVPERFAIEMIDNHDWICHNDLIWAKCLSENTLIFFKEEEGGYSLLSIKELYESKKQGFVPTFGHDMNIHWVKIINIVPTGIKDTKIITTKAGHIVEASLDHEFPFKITGGRHFGYIRGLSIKEDIQKNEYLYVNSELETSLPDGTETDYSDGFNCGFFIAEGNFRKNRKVAEYKDSIYSKMGRIRYGNPKEETWNQEVIFSCGKKDEERGYLKHLERYSLKKYNYKENILIIKSADKQLVSMIDSYITGNKCNEKHFTDKAFNTSISFMRGCVDGFLAGDGSYDEANNRWRVGIKPNPRLKDELEVMCRILHYDFRFESIHEIKNQEKTKTFMEMKFSIRKEDARYRIMSSGFITDKVENIERSKAFCYDLEIESLYHGRGTNASKTMGKTKTKKVANYNHLYFLANGIWTHNCNPKPEPDYLRFVASHEYIWFFTKNNGKKIFFYLNKKTMILQKEKPLGTKGEEDIDWHWIPHKRCGGSTNPSTPGTGWKVHTACKGAGCDKCEEGWIKCTCHDGERPGWIKWTYWRSYPYYFNQMYEKLKHPDVKKGHAIGGNKAPTYGNKTISGNEYSAENLQGRNMRDVLSIDISRYSGSHSAVWPLALAELIIDCACPREICSQCGLPRVRYKKKWSHCSCNAPMLPGVACDPFMGAGTSALAAIKKKVDIIGCEIKNDYAQESLERIKEFIKSLAIKKPKVKKTKEVKFLSKLDTFLS